MYLLNLHLENFQGIKDFRINFDGNNASIFGDNATGKTTIFNSVTWLLFDKPSTGAKNFTPKTKGTDGKDLHYLNHGVEASFETDDGRIIVLKKIYKENYKKKRGSAIEEFDGHVIDYFVNGVPFKEKEYILFVNNEFGSEEQIKTLMMPDFFSETLSWEARRKILLDVCGDVSDEDVINSSSELRELPNYLLMPGTADRYYSVDDFKKIANSKRTEINKELQTIPARVDEAQKAMPDITGINLASIKSTIKRLDNEIEQKEEQKENERRQILSQDGASIAIQNKIAALQVEISENKSAYITESNKENEATYEEINRLKSEQIKFITSLSDTKLELDNKQREFGEMNRLRQSYIDQYNKITAENWQGDEICPTCKRSLPEDEIKLAKDNFNVNKSRMLEEINLKGQQKCNKDMLANLQSSLNSLNDRINTIQEAVRTYDNLISAANQKLVPPIPFENTDLYRQLAEKINALQTDKSNANSAVSERISVINNQIADLQNSKQNALSDKSKLMIYDHQSNRIKELCEMEKSLSKEFELLQHGIYLCEEFIKAKVSMLTDRINGRFATVKFRLFIEQLNGGIKEDCEVLIPADGKLVPYTFANNAARINAGLEIIDSLSNHWQTSMPVFVDNAESVTKLKNINSQLIRLVVSEHDKKLRLETDSNISLKTAI